MRAWCTRQLIVYLATWTFQSIQNYLNKLSGKRLVINESGHADVRETSCPGKWLSGKRPLPDHIGHWVWNPAYLVSVPSQDKFGGLQQEGHQKWGNDGGGLLISPDGLASSWIVGVSASVILHCTIKSRRRFLLAPAHPGSAGNSVVRRLYVCVVTLARVYHFEHSAVSIVW